MYIYINLHNFNSFNLRTWSIFPFFCVFNFFYYNLTVFDDLLPPWLNLSVCIFSLLASL